MLDGRDEWAHWILHPFVVLWNMVLAVGYKEKLGGDYGCKWSNSSSKFPAESLLTSALVDQHPIT